MRQRPQYTATPPPTGLLVVVDRPNSASENPSFGQIFVEQVFIAVYRERIWDWLSTSHHRSFHRSNRSHHRSHHRSHYRSHDRSHHRSNRSHYRSQHRSHHRSNKSHHRFPSLLLPICKSCTTVRKEAWAYTRAYTCRPVHRDDMKKRPQRSKNTAWIKNSS